MDLINGSIQFSLLSEPQNKHNVADYVFWEQFKAETTLARGSDIRLNSKAIY